MQDAEAEAPRERQGHKKALPAGRAIFSLGLTYDFKSNNARDMPVLMLPRSRVLKYRA